MQQMTLTLEPGLAQRNRSLRDHMATSVYKYLRDPLVAQQETLAKLASIAEVIPGLMAAAGLTAPKGRARP